VADWLKFKNPDAPAVAYSAFSPAAFALAVSAHAAGIRAIFLIGTASARLKREPFAALYACAQIHILINRQHELSPKRFLQGDWTNAELWRGAQPVYFQKQSDWRATRLHVYSKGSSDLRIILLKSPVTVDFRQSSTCRRIRRIFPNQREMSRPQHSYSYAGSSSDRRP